MGSPQRMTTFCAYPAGTVDPVVVVGRDRREAETAGSVGGLRPVRALRPGLGRGGVPEDDGATGRGGDRHDGGGAERGTAGEHAGYDVADVLVVAGVGHLVEAGVTTAEPAGKSGTAASVGSFVLQQRQQFAHFVLLRRTTAPTWCRIPSAATLCAHICTGTAPE
ncbi:hypothetical protein STANM309S_00523 [Streptomyces tanashiensis]